MTLGEKWRQAAIAQLQGANMAICRVSDYLPGPLADLVADYLIIWVNPSLGDCTCASRIDSVAVTSGSMSIYCPAHGSGQMVFTRHHELVYPMFCYRDVSLFGVWASEASSQAKKAT